MLTILDDFRALRLGAGEPILLDLQLLDGDGVVEELVSSRRRATLSIFDDVRANLGRHEAQVLTDASGDFFRWVVDGSESDALYGTPGLLLQISERQDNGRVALAPASDPARLMIDLSAPGIIDYDDAPVSRFIHRVRRRFDRRTAAPPTFSYEIIPYEVIAPPVTGVVSADFSNPANSQLVGVVL